jgi:Zn-dependent protease
MSAILDWVRQLEFSTLLDTLVLVAASLLCITFHETCHGLVAWWLGDDTAKRMGRLSLNPLRHVDVMGLVVMAVAKFGWAKAVPIDMRKFRNPKLGMAVTAFAGPLSNVILAFFALLLRVPVILLYIRSGFAVGWEHAITFLEYVTTLSTGLAVFNLFPIPPLDGSKVVAAVLPERWYMRLMRVERYGMIVLAVLLLTKVLDTPLLYMRQLLLNVLMYIPNLLTELLLNSFV